MQGQAKPSGVLEVELIGRHAEVWPVFIAKFFLAITALAGILSQTWSKKKQIKLSRQFYKSFSTMFNSYAAWYRTGTLKIMLLSIQVPKTSSSQNLPQTAICKPKHPAWSLASMQMKKSWAAPFSSQNPQIYHGGLRKYQRGHLSTTLCASVEE